MDASAASVALWGSTAKDNSEVKTCKGAANGGKSVGTVAAASADEVELMLAARRYRYNAMQDV